VPSLEPQRPPRARPSCRPFDRRTRLRGEAASTTSDRPAPSTMAAACDGAECDPPPAAKDLAGRELQPPGPLPEAQLPVALPLRTAGRAAPLNRSPASPQPSTPSTPRTQRRPTSRTRAGRNKHEDVGAAVARAGRAQPNETPPLIFEASKPSRLSNTHQEPSDSACPTLIAFSCGPRERKPPGPPAATPCWASAGQT
jgi:hypothetical protein